MKLLFIIVLLFVSTNTFSQIKSVDINSLVSMMEGSFSTKEQSLNDSGFFDMSLHSRRIWTNRTDGKWLYIEEAFSDSIDKPTEQYVRQVTSTYEGRFKAADYLIPNAQNFAGEWMKEHPLSELTPDSLNALVGCEVIYTLMNDTMYQGSTQEKICPGDDDMTAYVTTEAIITPDIIISWKRGFDKYGNQITGSLKGGYIFKRIKE